MTPDLPRLFEVVDHTWPAARRWTENGWTLRDGQGGGKRVSAATRLAPDADIELAEAAMRKHGTSRVVHDPPRRRCAGPVTCGSRL